MKIAFAILLFVSQISASSLYFYLHGREQKCFYEELSHGLPVMGQFSTTTLDVSNNWSEDPGIKVHITVEVEATLAREVDKTASNKGVFNFVSSEYGTHVICVSVSGGRSEQVRFHLNFFYGEDTLNDHTSSEMNGLTHQIQNLKARADGLLREISLARTREEDFRNQSEAVNSKVMWWTFYQFILLGIVVAWQMRHLKTFFVSKKLV